MSTSEAAPFPSFGISLHLLSFLHLNSAFFCILLQVLQDDPNNAKALFRRAQAYTMTNDFEEAEQDFWEMQSLDPTTEADAKAGLAKVRRREQVRNSLLSEIPSRGSVSEEPERKPLLIGPQSSKFPEVLLVGLKDSISDRCGDWW
jgi:tetratricopeptide (TPR) repeat protein